MDVVGCLGCDVLVGRAVLPGGVIFETPGWVVNHCLGPINVGTLVVAPRRHVTAVADLTDSEVGELGPVLRRTSQVLERLCAPEQVYVCSWSHGQGFRRHLHIVVQPVDAALVARYGGARSEQLQALMLAASEEPDLASIVSFAERAREAFAAVG